MTGPQRQIALSRVLSLFMSNAPCIWLRPCCKEQEKYISLKELGAFYIINSSSEGYVQYATVMDRPSAVVVVESSKSKAAQEASTIQAHRYASFNMCLQPLIEWPIVQGLKVAQSKTPVINGCMAGNSEQAVYKPNAERGRTKQT